MARLTSYDENMGLLVNEEERLLSAKGFIDKDEMYKIMRHLAEKLKKYEDLEEQCVQENAWGLQMLLEKWKEFLEDIQHLYEYRKLEEQGRLLKLPCAVGDTVYCIMTGMKGTNPVIFTQKFDYSMIECFGKSIFLTCEEAEAALKELEKG